MTRSVRYRFHITGKVQGVFFRASARREAQRLGLSGLAKNESDGSVTIEVEGRERAVERFLAWARKGPERADVSAVEDAEVPVRPDETDFIVVS